METAKRGGVLQYAYIKEYLVWRGIVLACVENTESDRWFANFGDGATIVDWSNRVAHLKTRQEARDLIEIKLLRALWQDLGMEQH